MDSSIPEAVDTLSVRNENKAMRPSKLPSYPWTNLTTFGIALKPYQIVIKFSTTNPKTVSR